MPIINYVAVIAAGIAGWLGGGGWDRILGEQWVVSLGWSEADMCGPDGKRHIPIGPMVIAFIAQLVMALMLAGLLGHMGGPTVARGIISGVLAWVGFVVL